MSCLLKCTWRRIGCGEGWICIAEHGMAFQVGVHEQMRHEF